MKIKTSFGERCFDVFNTVFMTFLIIIMLYPMLYVAFASFSDSNLLQRHDGLLFAPLGFNLEAYKKVIMNPMILTGYANTLWVLVVGTLCSIITTVAIENFRFTAFSQHHKFMGRAAANRTVIGAYRAII